MNDLIISISNNLMKYRKSMGLSLDRVSKLTGISKSMLGQIERNEANPSVTTLWKIANGLHISFTSLLEPPESNTSIIRKNSLRRFDEDNGKYKVYPVFSFDSKVNFETFIVVLEAAFFHKSEAHEKGVIEFIYVCSGDLRISIGDLCYDVGEEDSIRFKADKEHIYENRTSNPVRLYIIIYYNN